MGHARGDEPLADFGDAFDLVLMDGLAVTAEIKQITKMQRLTRPQTFGEFAERVVAAGGNGRLQRMDQRTGPDMALARTAVFIQTTNRQGHNIAVKGFFVLGDAATLNTLQANTRNARRHTREEFRHQGP